MQVTKYFPSYHVKLCFGGLKYKFELKFKNACRSVATRTFSIMNDITLPRSPNQIQKYEGQYGDC